MGRALANRALIVADAQSGGTSTGSTELIDLTSGENRQAPEHVQQAAKDALDRGETHYTTRPGITELRQAIAQQSAAAGVPCTADSTVITNGGSEALYIALQCVVKSGDKVAIVGPVAPNVIQMIEFIGGTAVHLTGGLENGFYPSVDAVKGANAKSVLVTSPSVLTGTALSDDDLQQIIRASMDKSSEVILDRSAATCSYEPQPRLFSDESLGSYPIVIDSFSHGYGLGGWRIGYFTAPDHLMGDLRNLKQAMSICTTAVSQYAALAAVEGPDDWLTERRRDYARRRDRATELLAEAGLPVFESVAYPSIMIDVRSLDSSDVSVSSRLEREGVRVEPGSKFGDGTAGFIRIDLGAPESELWSGIEQIKKLAGERSRT